MMELHSGVRIMEIDLGSGAIKVTTQPPEVYQLYSNGAAFGLYLFLQEMQPEVEPYAPENMLIFSALNMTSGSRIEEDCLVITTKSPLSGAVSESRVGGMFSGHLKNNGYEVVIFRGRASKPVYLYIDGQQFSLRDASSVWGKTAGETRKALQKELEEDQIDITQIGPAGENLVKYACVLNMENRANGRNGTGAVMGSKNLKALVVKKTLSRGIK